MIAENVYSDLLRRIEKLELAVFGSQKINDNSDTQGAIQAVIDFSLNERAFAQKYCVKVSGPQKFALLTAFLLRGDGEKDVAYSEIRGLWDRMTAIIGSFNPVQSEYAKRKGWVNVTKKGYYCLTDNWKEAIG